VRNFPTLIEYIFSRAAVKHKKKTMEGRRKFPDMREYRSPGLMCVGYTRARHLLQAVEVE
jgi:hypothetical protein